MIHLGVKAVCPVCVQNFDFTTLTYIFEMLVHLDHTHTCTCTPLYDLDFVWDCRVSQHQKGKTNLDLLEREIVSGVHKVQKSKSQNEKCFLLSYECVLRGWHVCVITSLC